jgi:hypothetical protein
MKIMELWGIYEEGKLLNHHFLTTQSSRAEENAVWITRTT